MFKSLIERIKNEIISIEGENLISLVLYGSVARGEGKRIQTLIFL